MVLGARFVSAYDIHRGTNAESVIDLVKNDFGSSGRSCRLSTTFLGVGSSLHTRGAPNAVSVSLYDVVVYAVGSAEE